MQIYKNILRPLFFKLDPEFAHYRALDFLQLANKLGLSRFLPGESIINDPITIGGLKFPNRIGLAAGFDKDANCVDDLAKLGFGHIEVGTITPLAQDGNQKPRLYRLPKDLAVINRMGFNNCGAKVAASNLHKKRSGVIVGCNLGKNKITPNHRAHEDYVYSLTRLYELADYFTINVSSPNTPGLRDLQEKESLSLLFKELDKKRKELYDYFVVRRPIFVKISPDLTLSQIDEIVDLCLEWDIDGIIATNTTISRESFSPHLTIEQGGLSGRPLAEKSNQIIKHINDSTGGMIPIIGVGGVFNRDDYNKKIDAGASLVQIYTGLIYEGPFIVKNILG